jgi:hypothetical protein
MKLRWKRVRNGFWRSQTGPKYRYEIWRSEGHGPGGRPTGVISWGIVRLKTGGRYARYPYDFDHPPRSLKEAKALAQRDASGERARAQGHASGKRTPLRILQPIGFFPT